MSLLAAYFALAFSALTSATLLPGTSEAAFAAFVSHYPEHLYGAWWCAGIFNGLGSLISYGLGRLLPEHKRPSEKIMMSLQRYGSWLLLFAWAPIIGDALPLAAGWLRLNVLSCTLMLIAGKLARYGFIVWAIQTWI